MKPHEIANTESKKRNHTGHRMGAWHPKAKRNAATVNMARQMREQGMTYSAIGKQLGVPWRTVWDWVNYATRYAD